MVDGIFGLGAKVVKFTSDKVEGKKPKVRVVSTASGEGSASVAGAAIVGAAKGAANVMPGVKCAVDIVGPEADSNPCIYNVSSEEVDAKVNTQVAMVMQNGQVTFVMEAKIEGYVPELADPDAKLYLSLNTNNARLCAEDETETTEETVAVEATEEITTEDVTEEITGDVTYAKAETCPVADTAGLVPVGLPKVNKDDAVMLKALDGSKYAVYGQMRTVSDDAVKNGLPVYEFYYEFEDKTLKVAQVVEIDWIAETEKTVWYVVNDDGTLSDTQADVPAEVSPQTLPPAYAYYRVKSDGTYFDEDLNANGTPIADPDLADETFIVMQDENITLDDLYAGNAKKDVAALVAQDEEIPLVYSLKISDNTKPKAKDQKEKDLAVMATTYGGGKEVEIKREFYSNGEFDMTITINYEGEMAEFMLKKELIYKVALEVQLRAEYGNDCPPPVYNDEDAVGETEDGTGDLGTDASPVPDGTGAGMEAGEVDASVDAGEDVDPFFNPK